MKALDKVKLKDDTGVSRAYKIAIGNPTIATVAALQETWIRVVEEWTAALEATNASTDRAEQIRSAEKLLLEIEVSLFAKAGDWDYKNWGHATPASTFLRDTASKIHGAVNIISPLKPTAQDSRTPPEGEK